MPLETAQRVNRLVTVTDNEAPSIACPSNITATTDAGRLLATVDLGSPVTADNCSGCTVFTNDAPATFPIGVTTRDLTVATSLETAQHQEQL